MITDFSIPETTITTLLVWKNMGSSAAARLRAVMAGWERTPYGEGQRAKRIAVDCVQLCAAVIDEMFRSKPTPIPRLSAAVAMHAVRKGFSTTKAIRSMHYGSEIVLDGSIEPGDLLISRAEEHPNAPQRAAHAMIACATPWVVFHATPALGAHFAPIDHRTVPLIQIIRFKGKEQWR